ncbi:MAG: peptide MFS transporter [Gammaproteobacteria bacterium]|nr:peptide MFS transporter [Gammaproteobacteria bacterium]
MGADSLPKTTSLMSTPSTDAAAPPPGGKMHHPRGLYTLFFTEMWERLSYYGMRAILVLAMVDAIATGGLGLSDPVATAIYGVYTAAVYLLALPGGWIADRLLGMQKSVFYGGCIIALGHFSMAIPAGSTPFFLGMLLIAVGTGMLKPNVSAMVGGLYPEGGARRDAGFSIYYMGINLGALLAPLVCGTLGEKVGWHYGFAAAGVGMVIGLIWYKLTQHRLGEVGRHPSRTGDEARDAADKRRNWIILGVGVAIGILIIAGIASGLIPFNAIAMATWTAYIIIALAVVFFAYVYIRGKLSRQEKLHVGGIILFFIAAAIFWSGFEQAGSTFNLIAERFTDLVYFGWEMPASWTQMINPIFIIILAPFFAALWINLGRRNLNPSLPFKLAIGLIQLGLGFVVIMFAAQLIISGEKVDLTWLLLTYLLHTTGELCLSPIGLSAVTKLAPARFEGQMMGTWFMGAALGNLIAGLMAGWFTEGDVNGMAEQFRNAWIVYIAVGILMLLALPWLKKLMGNVK